MINSNIDFQRVDNAIETYNLLGRILSTFRVVSCLVFKQNPSKGGC